MAATMEKTLVDTLLEKNTALMLSMKKMFEESLAALLEKDNEIDRLKKEVDELKEDNENLSEECGEHFTNHNFALEENKQLKMNNMSAVVLNIKCNECGNILPPHTVEEHLDVNNPIHKCPHKSKSKHHIYDDYDEMAEALNDNSDYYVCKDMDAIVNVAKDNDYHIYEDFDEVVEAVKDNDYHIYEDWDEVVEAVKNNSDLYVFDTRKELTDYIEENYDFTLQFNG